MTEKQCDNKSQKSLSDMMESVKSERCWGDVLSTFNIVMGGIAMMYVFDRNLSSLKIASMLFFVILALDGLDGIVARRTRQSPFGPYLDSVSDGIGFVLLPSFMIYATYYKPSVSSIEYLGNSIVVFSLGAYMGMGFYRLGRFAMIKKHTPYFQGIPVSLPAILVVASMGLGAPRWIVVLFLVICLPLLLSNIRFPKLSRNLSAPAALSVLLGILAFLLLLVDSHRYSLFANMMLLLILAFAALYISSPIWASEGSSRGKYIK